MRSPPLRLSVRADLSGEQALLPGGFPESFSSERLLGGFALFRLDSLPGFAEISPFFVRFGSPTAGAAMISSARFF